MVKAKYGGIKSLYNNICIELVRCCKPSDLTYTLELEKQLKTKSLSKVYWLKSN